MSNREKKIPKIWAGRGARIKAAREAMGLSPEAFGKRLSVSRPAVYKWEENDAIEITPSNLEALAALTGKSEEWFKYGAAKQAVQPAVALAEGDLEERPRTADRVTVSKRDRPDWVDQSDAKAKFWGLVFKLGPTMTDEQAEIACRLLEAIAPAVPAKPADPAPKKRGPAKPKG